MNNTQRTGGHFHDYKSIHTKPFPVKDHPQLQDRTDAQAGEVHYIGGADILPAPLETEEEGRMISLLGSEDDKEARAA